MALEAGTYISDLVPTNPDPADSESYGALHLQLIKTVLKNTFPLVKGPINIADTQFASQDYCNQLAFAAALPAQAGNKGAVVATNGSAASWVAPSAPQSVLTSTNGLPVWQPLNMTDVVLMNQGII